MDAFITALIITAFIMMGSTLFVMIWEMIDNKRSVRLEEETYQQVITFLDNEEKTNIETLINMATLSYLNKGE